MVQLAWPSTGNIEKKNNQIFIEVSQEKPDSRIQEDKQA
jgi:hypothetical protein